MRCTSLHICAIAYFCISSAESVLLLQLYVWVGLLRTLNLSFFSSSDGSKQTNNRNGHWIMILAEQPRVDTTTTQAEQRKMCRHIRRVCVRRGERERRDGCTYFSPHCNVMQKTHWNCDMPTGLSQGLKFQSHILHSFSTSKSKDEAMTMTFPCASNRPSKPSHLFLSLSR